MPPIGTSRNLTQQFLRYRDDARRAGLHDAREDRCGRAASAGGRRQRAAAGGPARGSSARRIACTPRRPRAGGRNRTSQPPPLPCAPGSATAKLLGAALGGGEGDIELGSLHGGASAAPPPRWVAASDAIKGEMRRLKELIGRLKECAAAAARAGAGGALLVRRGGAPSGARCGSVSRPTARRPPPPPAAQRAHAKALLVTFDDGGGGARARAEALTREVQLAFRRLDQEVRAMGEGGGGGAVRTQVQRQLAQALFKLSVEFRWGSGGGGGGGGVGQAWARIRGGRKAARLAPRAPPAPGPLCGRTRPPRPPTYVIQTLT